MPEEIKLRIERGEIIDFPSIPHGAKPRHRFAVISRDYRSPEGIHREPLSANRREPRFPRFNPSTLKLHDALEFSVEWHHPGRTQPRSDRRYFVITELADDHLVLQLCDSALAAIDLGIELDIEHSRALKEELRRLKDELEKAEDPAF